MFELSRESPVALVDQICERVTGLVRRARAQSILLARGALRAT